MNNIFEDFKKLGYTNEEAKKLAELFKFPITTSDSIDITMKNLIDRFCELPLGNSQLTKDIKRVIEISNERESYKLIDKFKENVFSAEFISDEKAEMLYHTIMKWKEKADMYDDLCR